MPSRGFLRVTLLLLPALLAAAPGFAAPTPEVAETLFACERPAPDVRLYPQTSNPVEWAAFIHRDNANQACSGQRAEDQFRNEQLRQMYLDRTPGSVADTATSQLSNTDRLGLSTGKWLPGFSLGDPFRDPRDWEASGRGRFLTFKFVTARTQAHLAGDIFLPPSSMPGPYPGVIIATGGSQHYRQLYYWAAEGLAEEGYQVMMFDFQSQGDSETFNHYPDGSLCTSTSCLLDQTHHDLLSDPTFYYENMRDAIRFFFSTPSTPYGSSSANYQGTALFNPAWASLDPAKVGVAGHSVGSIVSNDLGQEDQRIKAIVRWGHFGYTHTPYVSKMHAPTLIINNEYGPKGPQPFFSLPPAYVHEYGYQQLVDLKLPAMLLHLRSSTHFEWTYAGGRYASRYGERVSFYYTLAWLDAYLKGLTDDAKRNQAFDRLSARTFDASADIHSIGAGTYEEDPDGVYRNRPYTIEGKRVADRLSFIYKSKYWLRAGGLTCDDMRSGTCGS